MGLLAMQSSLLLIISLLVGHTFARDPLPFFYDLVKELGLTTTHATAKQRNCTYAFTHDDDTIRSNAPVWPPPQIIPKPLLHYYSMNGSIPITMAYQQQNSFREESHYWKGSVIQEMISGKDKNDFCQGQRRHDCFKPLRRNDKYIKNKLGLVLGCDYPWAESLLIRLGASRLVTLERTNTILDNPAMTAYTSEQFNDMYLLGKLPMFDFAFSYSYIEHEGLGKSGEGLHPFGDIKLLDQVFCSLKPGGVFFLAVPIGPDHLHWNTYRTYGKIRLPMLVQGWELLDVLGNFTSFTFVSRKPTHKVPIIVLRKPE